MCVVDAQTELGEEKQTRTKGHALGEHLSSIHYLYGFLKPFKVALFFLGSAGVCFFLPISLSRDLTSPTFYNQGPGKLPHREQALNRCLKLLTKPIRCLSGIILSEIFLEDNYVTL